MIIQKEDWRAWLIMAVGVVIAPIAIWVGVHSGLNKSVLSTLETLLFTIGMLGVSLSHFFVSRYEQKLKNYRIPYQFFVPGAYGLTKIQQTYKYQFELFSAEDKKSYTRLQFFSYVGIFFLSVLFGFGMVLLYSTYIR
jgi:hypothetical protein